MSKAIPEAIRFRLMWRGRQPGDVLPVTVDDRQDGLSFGMADTLVQRGIAEFVEPRVQAAAQAAAPVANNRRR